MGHGDAFGDCSWDSDPYPLIYIKSAAIGKSIDLFSIIVKIVDLPVVDGGDEVDAQAEALAA